MPVTTYFHMSDMIEFPGGIFWAVSTINDNGNASRHLFRYNGTTWSEQLISDEMKSSALAMWGPSENELYVVGESGTIYRRVTKGKTE